MDALKASLRVVLAHIRQVEIKIIGGVWWRIGLGNFNALKKQTKMNISIRWISDSSIYNNRVLNLVKLFTF